MVTIIIDFTVIRYEKCWINWLQLQKK